MEAPNVPTLIALPEVKLTLYKLDTFASKVTASACELSGKISKSPKPLKSIVKSPTTSRLPALGGF